MRGTLRRGERGPDVHGIIPAHAGNTGFRVRADAECGDHPRACGEHPAGAPRMGRTGGSSPRMRGTLHRADSRPRDQGIIPAHAGNTEVRNFFKYLYRDHPRACGEHLKALASTFTSKGSSPRMRGTPSPQSRGMSSTGIIPAHAGNTLSAIKRHEFNRDHPRACGEHRATPKEPHTRVGSSPRMRGTLTVIRCYRPFRGIIPAHAGNTKRARYNLGMMEDHPRACGEHTSRLAQYRGFLIRSVCFLFSFILSTSLLAGIYWRCSIRDEEHRQKTLPSHWMAV